MKKLLFSLTISGLIAGSPSASSALEQTPTPKEQPGLDCSLVTSFDPELNAVAADTGELFSHPQASVTNAEADILFDGCKAYLKTNSKLNGKKQLGAHGTLHSQENLSGTRLANHSDCHQESKRGESALIVCEPQPACREVRRLYSWWSPSREDNFATTDSRWADRIDATRSPDYRMFRVEGMALRTQKPGTIPLYSWWSPSRGDNFITSDPRWAGARGDTRQPDYGFVRIEGYIHDPNLPQPEGNSFAQLSSFWSPSRGDNYATTDPQLGRRRGDRINPDYSMYRNEGFLYTSCRGN